MTALLEAMEQPVAAPPPAGEEPALRDRAWTGALLLTLAFSATMTARTLWWDPVLHGVDRWSVDGDVWLLVNTGRYVGAGALGYVYSAQHGFYSLPLGSILMAPMVLLGDKLQLLEGYPFQVAHPTMWWLVGPWEMLWAVPLLAGVRRLAWEAGARRGLLGLQALVCAGSVVVLVAWGHGEDTLALAGVCWALVAARQERWRRAGLLLALAICAKQWALVALPFLYLQVPAGSRRTFLLSALAPPALLAAFPLAVDWHNASTALLVQPVPTGHVTGHRALWLDLLGRDGSRLTRAAEVAASVPAAWLTRHRGAPAALAALGLVLLLRPLLEPMSYPYYIAPAVAVVSVACWSRRGRSWAAPGVLLACAGLWALPGNPVNTWWWAGELVAVGGAVALLAAGWPVRARHGGAQRALPPLPAGTPESAGAGVPMEPSWKR